MSGSGTALRLRVNLRDVVLLAAGFAFGGLATVRFVYAMVWGAPPSGGRHALAVAVLAGIAAHELVHAIAFVAVGVRWSELRFGASLRHGLLYVGCGPAVRAGSYRLVTLAPGVLLGLFPLVAGLAIGWYRAAQFGAALLGAAGGDLCIVWAMRHVPASARVGEDPSDARVLVIEPGGATPGG